MMLSVVICLYVLLPFLVGQPISSYYEDDGSYKPWVGENSALAGSDGDDGMYRPENYNRESAPSNRQWMDSNNNYNSIDNYPTQRETEWSPNNQAVVPSEADNFAERNEETVRNQGGSVGSQKVVCYFETWATDRSKSGSYGEKDILDAPCTHVIYSFATLDTGSNQMQFTYQATLIQKLKEKGVKVMLAVGGARDSEGSKYSNMASNPESRKVFINSVLDIIQQNDFDGFDVDWEFPTCTQVPDGCGNLPQDKENFVLLIRELRQALGGKLLTIATHPTQMVVSHAYDLPALTKEVDWFNLMTYDLHGSWDGKALHHSPLFAGDGLSTEGSVKLYKGQGVPGEKIVIGMPLYGRSLKLADPSQHGYGSPINGVGDMGPYTKEAGFLGYLEICEKVKYSGWKMEQGTSNVGPLAYGDGEVVGFDDTEMAKKKAEYAKEQGLGGVMVWALSHDDFVDSCGCGKYPILTALKNTLVDGKPVNECQL